MKLNKLQKELNKIDPGISVSVNELNAIVLKGTVDDYSKVVKAGSVSVSKDYAGVVNDIKVEGFTQQIVTPSLKDNALDGKKVDVLVIGGGIVGAACLRELSRYNLSSLLVERGPDLANGQSSKNGGVVHVGLNFSSSSQKLKYCVKGNEMYRQLSEDLHVAYENEGQVTFARAKWEMLILKLFKKQGKKKGIGGLEIMSREELLKKEPSVPDWSCGGLFMGTGGITCPHRMTIAMAENAVENGAEVSLNTIVLDMVLENDRIVKVITNRGTIYPKAVVNAAGIYVDYIADMAKDRTFTVHPRVGTDLITDKKAGHMAKSSMGKTPFTLSPSQINALPDKPFAFIKATIKNLHSHSKGVGLIHSVDGNMLVGPNADEVMDREDTSTSREVVNHIIDVQREVQPNFKASDVIAYFTGVRAPIYEEDFVIRQGIRTKNIFECAGVQSPGITAAPAIAVDIRDWVKEYLISTGIKVEDNKSFNPVRKAKPVLSELSLEERDRLIKENPAYGEIVCRCEEISRGEIIDCINSPIPVRTVDGIKRRIRPGMGRCQGGFCMPNVMKIISEETGIPVENIKKSTDDAFIAFSKTK